MRILVVGAGALGGVAGAWLARAGEDVTLLEANAARARLLAADGLQVTRPGEEEVCVPLNIVTSVDGLEPFDLVFIAVKTYQTEEAMRAALPVSGPATRFLTMQNGIGNTDVMARMAGPERVLCGITYHSIQHVGPGRLQFRKGIKPIQIAPFDGIVTPAVEAVGELFRRAGLDTNVVPNIEHTVWQKLLHNAVINPVSAITGLTCRELLADEDLIAFMRDLADEILAVMRARGVPIVDEEDPFRPLMGSMKALGKNRPTMWQDLARGTRTEVDALNGAVVREAERLGLKAPHNAALVRFIHSRERQRFLNREAISRKLGLERAAGAAAVSAAGSATDAAVQGAAGLATDSAAGTPRRHIRAPGKRDWGGNVGTPLDATRQLKFLVQTYYRDLATAAADPTRRVAACSSLAPVEIVRALGMVPYFPENHAVLIAASRQSGRYIARAAAEGFSQFVSAAMRADVGALLDGTSPLTKAHDVAGPPRPVVVVYSTNTGHELLRWFEFYGSHYDVPVLGLHPPPALHELEPMDVDAASRQLVRLAERLEETMARDLDLTRLAETVRASAAASALWSEILGLARATPAPFTFFDALIHLAPMLLLRGTPAAVEYYRTLRDEIEERVAHGVAAVPGEAHRFYWDGPPIWGGLRSLARLFAAHDTAIVGSTFCETFALPGLDPHDPFASMARAYTGVFGNRSNDYRTAWLAQEFERFGVDGAVFHDCRTTPEASHVRHGLARRTERITGVPSFVIEADSHDLRLFTLERLESHLGAFLERSLAHGREPLVTSA